MKISEKVLNYLQKQTQTPRKDCAEFMEEFNRFTAYLASHFGVKQKDVALKVYKTVLKAEQLDEAPETPAVLKDNEAINEDFLAKLF